MFQPENRAQITSCHCASGVSVALVSPEPTPHVELASLAGNIHVSSRRTNLRKQNTALQAAVKRVPVHTVRFFDTLKKLFEHPFTRFTHAPLIAHKRRFRGRGKFWTFFLGVLNVPSGLPRTIRLPKVLRSSRAQQKKTRYPLGFWHFSNWDFSVVDKGVPVASLTISAWEIFFCESIHTGVISTNL